MIYVSCFIAMLGQLTETDLFIHFLAVLFVGFSVALFGSALGVFTDGD